MPRLLSTTVSGAWHPILTFERRRLELLDWAEHSVRYTGFANSSDLVGLDLGQGLRVQFEQSRFLISSVIPGTGVERAGDFVDAAFEILEPRHPDVMVIHSQWAVPAAYPYDLARQVLAGYISFGRDPDPASGFVAADSSVLLDVLAEGAKLQVEYGVVAREELIERLVDPDQGRIRGLPVGRRRDLEQEAFADTSLYFAASWVPSDRAGIRSAADLLETATHAVEQSQSLVSTLVKQMLDNLGVNE